ncbi:putative AbiEii toxin of type IV toxin-antitoxin system [Paraburkholderia silvatlantica]|uniref:Putative AbiEii toxin of type IV toxin-antitoxin system n=1 Tax=Paraburkholderia silvatlantica TaxID=321895 RepID=A0A2V4UUW4_9BURK|nr:AAA family ATPase [Paraburkholderia silvatlantica]PYE27967.1 putative AbiEii toxin of type IV toxin-antitoxin system [Paraburkholderia silvatlantica]
MQNEYFLEGSPAARPSLVQDFRIEGLYGYRTIGISSDFAATILIAKNGSGKTTLLGALDAFLKGQFGRLTKLQFTRIVCKLRDVDSPLIVTHDEIIESQIPPDDSFFKTSIARLALDPALIFDFIENDYRLARGDFSILQENEVYDSICQKYRWNMSDVRNLCDRLLKCSEGRNHNIDYVRSILESSLKDVQVVYLPTYRRIELPLNTNEGAASAPGAKKKSIQSRLGLTKRGLFDAEIRFGLSDISERLDQLNQMILRNSDEGYREISANIINELLSGAFETENPNPDERPSKDALELFFSRLRAGTRNIWFRGRDVVIPDIDKIYSGENLPPQSIKFLNYFLSKLNKVIKKTRDIELMVEEFIVNCNRYLAGEDASTILVEVEAESEYETIDPAELQFDFDGEDEDLHGLDSNYFEHESNDDKLLKLNREDLSVEVVSLATKRNVPLESLSSGEKQMISLFSRLYLYPGEKIILIDEPELSLSIDWQRKILPDIVNAPTSAQVIAITHSPFIFENELDPYARSLSLEINAPDQQRG